MLIVDGKKYPGEWHNDLPASSKQIAENPNFRNSGENRKSR